MTYVPGKLRCSFYNLGKMTDNTSDDSTLGLGQRSEHIH